MLSATKLSTPSEACGVLHVKGKPTKHAPSPRTGSTAVPTPHGTVLVFGGASAEEGLSNDLYELAIDTSTNTASWKPLNHLYSGALPAPRYDHTAFWIPSQMQMVVLGGAGPDGSCLNDVWVYDVVSFRWEQLKPAGNVPSPRTMRGAATIHPQDSSKILVWGGGADGSRAVSDQSIHVLDIANSSWTTHTTPSGSGASSAPCPRLGHFLITHSPDSVLLLGGMNADTIFDELWSLSIDSWEWTKLSTNPAFAVSGHAALSLARLPRIASPKTLTNKISAESTSSSAAILWTGGLTKSMSISDKWHVASAATNWEPHEIPLGIAMSTDGSFARLDHCLFPVLVVHESKRGISENQGGQETSAMPDDDQEEGLQVGLFGGMNHGGIFHDVHVFNLDGHP